jgi:hypothetical protein
MCLTLIFYLFLSSTMCLEWNNKRQWPEIQITYQTKAICIEKKKMNHISWVNWFYGNTISHHVPTYVIKYCSRRDILPRSTTLCIDLVTIYLHATVIVSVVYKIAILIEIIIIFNYIVIILALWHAAAVRDINRVCLIAYKFG